jgi:hypothetical protein
VDPSKICGFAVFGEDGDGGDAGVDGVFAVEEFWWNALAVSSNGHHTPGKYTREGFSYRIPYIF